MAANINPIFTLTPNVSFATIVQTSAQVKSDGTSAGTAGADIMYLAFTAGANNSYVDRVRFQVVSTAVTNSVATVLRAYVSTVAAPGATTAANTWCCGEISVPIISAGNTTNATNYYDIMLGFAIPTGKYIHVSQAIAQTANQNWIGIVFGGDY